MRRNFRLSVVLGVLLVLQVASSSRVRGPERGVRLTPCRIDGFPEEIKCTSVSVPESRSGASDRRVSIHVAIVPALARVAARDPLVLLAGGPGQAASSFGPWIASVFAPIRRHRDILLIDQRGTGLSQALRCRASESSAGAPVLEREEKASRECLASLDGDPRHYANGPAMEDLDEIRAALGYTQLNLWGGSYGTRAALVYMRAHPRARALGRPRWRRAVEPAFSALHREGRRARAGSSARRLRFRAGLLGCFSIAATSSCRSAASALGRPRSRDDDRSANWSCPAACALPATSLPLRCVASSMSRRWRAQFRW